MTLKAKANNLGSLFEGDKVIWIVLFFLCAVSVLEVYSATSNIPNNKGAYWAPVLMHTLYLAIGVGVTWVIHRIPCRYFGSLVVIGPVISIPLLIAVMFAGEINDTARWIKVFGISVQPSEIAKGSLVVIVAWLMSTIRDEKGATAKSFWWIMGFSAVICGLIVTENLSTAVLTFFVILMMMFIGNVPWRHFSILLGLIAIACVMGYCTLRFTPDSILDKFEGTPLERIKTWSHRVRDHVDFPTNPEEYDLNTNPQITQAHIAIATCNIVGRGPGNSIVRDFLPHAYSDYIYAIIIEELGIIGCVFMVIFYITLLYRAARIAGCCEKSFPAYLMMGLALLIVTQALINMAVAVDLFPVTGQPLPIVSKGGSSIMVNCAYVGMMLSISKYAQKQPEATKI